MYSVISYIAKSEKKKTKQKTTNWETLLVDQLDPLEVCPESLLGWSMQFAWMDEGILHSGIVPPTPEA